MACRIDCRDQVCARTAAAVVDGNISLFLNLLNKVAHRDIRHQLTYVVWCKYLFQLLVVEVQIHEHPAEKVLLWVLIQGHDHIGIEFGEDMLLRFFVFVDCFKIPLLAFVIVGFVHGIGYCTGRHDNKVSPNINRATPWRKQLLKFRAKLMIILAFPHGRPMRKILFLNRPSGFQHRNNRRFLWLYCLWRNSHRRFPWLLHRFWPRLYPWFLLRRLGMFLRFLLPGIFPEWFHSAPSLNMMS